MAMAQPYETILQGGRDGRRFWRWTRRRSLDDEVTCILDCLSLITRAVIASQRTVDEEIAG
jgi:hypothetical protein